jgi:flagellar hook-basal body complex protein FliE
MAINLGSLSSTLALGGSQGAAAQLAALARTGAIDYTAVGSNEGGAGDSSTGLLEGISADSFSLAGLGASGKAGAGQGAKGGSFESALLKAMDGVSSSQAKSDDLLQRVVADPNSVDAQDVTIAMAEANMSLNLAKTIMSRVVTAWKDIINTR